MDFFYYWPLGGKKYEVFWKKYVDNKLELG
jgi:hypothetical protein